ncbi:type II toxin-antitoxin system VapC family toxin [Amycolatopsis alkalitolerans]|uniref:Type II toxin-antitoxin system VapC family toxin n=1 Tax=Amycolatopsis alkalitolerans TaxID=2547244 RepID=A0A5C4LVC0_9PSEU|nr:type II toxin-antitoxin system VapC family toxin [Amycolatopsis alkalitolerans]TNC23219.1 type II toxin-antitoxin system VapC family toxin [Amycolatopsis alkalitolerans]
MSTFADSSALVKIYADEPGHEHIRELPALVISQIARVEVPAALWRKYRLGELTPKQVSLLEAEFEADFYGTFEEPSRFAVIPLTDLVLEAAARLTRVHGLRGYDATQLACAQLAASADRDCRTFAAMDKALRAAAVGEGFSLLPA